MVIELDLPDDDGLALLRQIQADASIAHLFALTTLLEIYGMAVVAVDSGAEALRQLAVGRGIDIVLMDSKCIDDGASDYASKPVDTEQLLGQLSMWLS